MCNSSNVEYILKTYEKLASEPTSTEFCYGYVTGYKCALANILTECYGMAIKKENGKYKAVRTVASLPPERRAKNEQ